MSRRPAPAPRDRRPRAAARRRARSSRAAGGDDGAAAPLRRPAARRASRRPTPPAHGDGHPGAAGRDRPGRSAEGRGRRPRRRRARRPAPAGRGLVRCADFEGQRYCLDSGWTDDTQAEVQARTAAAARTIAARADRPTDAPATSTARRPCGAARRDEPAARAAAERAELTAGRPLGRQGLAAAPRDPGRRRCRPASSPRHPEARAAATATAAPTRRRAHRRRRRPTAPVKRCDDYPQRGTVLNPHAGRRAARAPTGAARRRCR